MSRFWVVFGMGLLAAGLLGCEEVFDDDFIFEQDFQFTEPAEGLVTLDLRTHNGAVDVRGVGTDEVDIRAFRYVRARDETDGRRYARDVEADVRVEGDTLVVRTVLPVGSPPSYVEEVRIDYDVMLPDDMEVRVLTDNGAVEVVAVDENVRIRTTNGAVTVEDVLGDVDARTSNGAVTATFGDVDGDVSIRTDNGAIDVLVRDECAAPVSLESGNGALDLRVRELLEPVDLRASNGQITVVIDRALEADVQARTSNGRIEARLPFGASFDLSADTSNGVIDTDWGRSDGFLDIEVNGGDYRVDLETSSGTIRVTQG